MPPNANGCVRFEEFEIDRAKWQLRRRDQILPLSRKTFDLLLYLIDHADRVVSKEELLRALWPNSFVEESNLTQHIFLLRKALSRQAPETKIIETVPGRGYRLAVPVTIQAEASQQEQAAAGASADPFNQPRQPLLEAGLAPPPPGAPDEEGEGQPSTARQTVGSHRFFEGATITKQAAWLSLLSITALLLGGVYAVRSKKQVIQGISAYQQLTHDGHAKWLGGTSTLR